MSGLKEHRLDLQVQGVHSGPYFSITEMLKVGRVERPNPKEKPGMNPGFISSGRGGEDRTRDLHVPNVAPYRWATPR